MRSPRTVFRIATLTLCCIALAACGDRDPSSLTGVRKTLNSGGSLDAEINTLIAEIFKRGHGVSVRARWDNTKREQMRNPEGRKKHVALVRWIQSKTNDVTPVGGETKEHAVARLTLLMSLYLYGGPAAEPPVITPETDATLEVIEPTVTDTAKTPAEQAAVVFPAGAVSEPTVVVVREDEEAAAQFTQECSGPLATKRCQYAMFYKFDVFPDVKLNSPATVAVCRVPTADRQARADHDRFRLAHDRPVDPAAYHPQGTIEDGIEILPFVSTGALTTCNAEELEHEHIGSIREEGVMRYVAAHAKRGVFGVGRAIGDFLTPKSLYAIDRGGGGSVFMFSNFNMIDPQSEADLAPEPFTLSSSDVTRGEQVTVNAFNISNTGTGPATAFGSTIVLASDPALTEGVVTLATLPAVASLNPEVPAVISATTVTIPEGTSLGTHYIGVKVDIANAVAETNETNNGMSVAVIVHDEYTLFCPDGPEGSYGSLRAAVDATPSGGTVAVCDGEHNVDSVTINKPLTLTSQNPGFNAWLGDVDPAFGGQVGRGAIRINGIEEGTVRIENIGFRHNGRAIILGAQSLVLAEGGVSHPGIWDRVEINNVRFQGRHIEGGIGVQVWQAGNTTGHVDITNSRFESQFIGVFVTSHSEVNVNHSVFDGFTAGSVTYSGFNPGGDGSQQRLAFGRFEDNQVRNCGPSGCFRGVLMTNGTVARNLFEAGAGGSKQFGILVTRPSNTPHPRQPLVIEDNTIISTGLIGEGAPNTSASWNVQFAIQLSDAPGVTNIVRRNQVVSSYMGLSAQGPMDATDNNITGGYVGFSQGNPATTVRIERNNFVGQTVGFFGANGNTGGSSYRCNWWGQNTGPATPPGYLYAGPPYAPWAMAPIAGTSSVCNPTMSMATVRACPSGPDGGPNFTLTTVAQAYNVVQAGGTVRLCDATHVVNNINIRKSVTFEPDGAFRPIVDGNGIQNPFALNSVEAATTHLIVRGIRIQNSTFNNIYVTGNYGSLLVDNVEFFPPSGVPNEGSGLSYSDGVGVFNANGGGVTVQNSTFTGGDIGVHQSNTANIVVLNSVFTNQSNAAIHAGSGGSVRAEGNTISGCGQFWCIGVFTGGNTQLINNTINVSSARPSINAIQVHGGTYVISGNVIAGTGGARTSDFNSWPMHRGITVAGNGPTIPATATLTGNTISGAHTGLGLYENSSGTATDNIISNVWDGAQFYRTSMTLRRSNITNYMAALNDVTESPASSATCNWWGSAAGPQNMPAWIAASFYTPFATQPIAGNAGVVCPAP